MSEEKVKELRTRLGEVADISAALSLLQWDQEVYMPPKGAIARGLQLATLSALRHRLFTAPEMGALLEALYGDLSTLSADDAALVSESRHDYQRATALPEAFVYEFAEEQSRAYVTWIEARKQSDFSMFLPHLEKIVTLLRRKADYHGYDQSPYDALLEDYERGMTVAVIRPLFSELASRQSELVKRIVAKQGAPDRSWLERSWDEQRQWDFTLDVLKDLGYDLDAGRQDRSVHPFTMSLDMGDVRITTRTSSTDPFSSLMGSIHECGHALYDQGFLEQDRRTPLAEGISLGIHESQSRMWENMIGRSLPFWRHYAPKLAAYFPDLPADISAETICSALNRVRPSLIRVEADECTYNLHIVLRFELEVQLIEGALAARDLPEAWNAKMKQYLGLAPPDDAHGCLQDIHWSHGAMGYFPTYALGNLYAAQMFEKIVEEIPSLWRDVERGDFSGLLAWLRTHVHRHGRRKQAEQLIRDITGRGLDGGPYLRYLEDKYLGRG